MRACTSCQLACVNKISPGVMKQKLSKVKEGDLERDKYKVGDLVFTDQFFVVFPGELLEGYGHESNNDRYHGGTVFNDAVSGIIWVENQVLLGFG